MDPMHKDKFEKHNDKDAYDGRAQRMKQLKEDLKTYGFDRQVALQRAYNDIRSVFPSFEQIFDNQFLS